MFIRFVVGSPGDHHRGLSGPFSSARAAIEAGYADAFQEERVQGLFDWFNEHMPCPPFGQGRFAVSATCWFKDTARDYIANTRELVGILDEMGIPTHMYRSANPGKILYEDDIQVVVEEWSSLG